MLLGQRHQRYLQKPVAGDAEWSRLAREEKFLGRQIESKTRLLLFTQRVRSKTGRARSLSDRGCHAKLANMRIWRRWTFQPLAGKWYVLEE